MDELRADWLKSVGNWWHRLTQDEREDIKIVFAEVEVAEILGKEME